MHGVDKSPRVLDALREGRPHLFEPGVEEGLGRSCSARASTSADELPAGGVDVAIICVSTPGRSRHARARSWRICARPPATWPSAARPTRSSSCAAPCRSARAAPIVLPELAARWARRRGWPSRRSGPSRGRRCASWRSCRRWSAGSTRRAATRRPSCSRALTRRVVPVVVARGGGAGQARQQLPHRPDLLLRQRGRAAGRAVAASIRSRSSARANVDYPRPGPRQARLRRAAAASRRIPYILLSAARARPATRRGWSAPARRLNEHLPVHVAERLVALIRAARGRAEGARLAGAGLGLQGLAAHRRHARRARARRCCRSSAPPGLELRGHDYLVAPGRHPRPGRHAGVGRGRLRRRRRGARHHRTIPSTPSSTSPALLADAAAARRCVFDSWRILDEEAVRQAGVGYAAHRVWLESSSSAARASSARHLAARLADEGHALTLVDDLSRGRPDATLAALCARPGVRFVAGRPHRARRAGRAAARVGSGLHAGGGGRRAQRRARSRARHPHEHAGADAPARLAARRRRDALLRLDQRGLRGLGRARAWCRCRRPRTCRWRSPTSAAPRFAYAISKLLGEAAVIHTARARGLRCGHRALPQRLRPAHGRRPRDPRDGAARASAARIRSACTGREQRRAFCHVADAVEAMLRLTTTERRVRPGREHRQRQRGDASSRTSPRWSCDARGFAPALERLPAPAGSPDAALSGHQRACAR